jgi:hypothetical protein
VMQHFSVDYSSFGEQADEVPEVSVGDVDHGGDGEGERLVDCWLVAFLFLLHFSFIIRKSPIFQQRLTHSLYVSEQTWPQHKIIMTNINSGDNQPTINQPCDYWL